ncbi:MAG: glycosyltransferase family 2 protein [Candidatus Hodarchaeota archaeon]
MVAADTNCATIAIIMLTVNQRENTIQCLSSFRSVKSPPYRIIVWDNGSLDGTVDAVRDMFPDVLVYHHPNNLGAAAGRNAAAELAINTLNPTHLFFIDNDTIVTPGFLDALLEPFTGRKTLAQTEPKIKFLKDKKRLQSAGGARIRFWLGSTTTIGYGEIDRSQYEKPSQCIPSGCTLVRTDVFQKVGGFDSQFDPYGTEDLDFSLRIRKAGYYGLYVPKSLIFHNPTQTFEQGKYTEKYARVKARNWILLMRRHASPLQQLGFIFLGAPYLFIKLIIREGRKGNLAAAGGLLRGMLDFLKSLDKTTVRTRGGA